jgi:hypothetical protein
MNGHLGALNILLNDAPVVAIVEQRVYIDKPPQGAEYPLIVLESREATPITSKSGAAELDKQIIGAFAYATSSKGRETLAQAMRNALDWKTPGSYNGIAIRSIEFSFQTEFFEKETNRDVYVADQEYTVWVGR